MLNVATFLISLLCGEVIDLPSEIVVDKSNPTPDFVSDRRIQLMLDNLPEGYKVKVGLKTRWWDNKSGLMTYALVMTPINAEGKPNGEEVHHWNWYQGPSRTVQYRDGLKHGIEKEYTRAQRYSETLKRIEHLNVLAAEIPWHEGKIHGTKRILFPDGNVRSEIRYEDGVPTGESKNYDDRGNLTKVISYTDGKMHGEVKDYWPNGQLKRVVPYKMGKVDGIARDHYMSGQLKWERPFKDNLQHGIEKYFEADGQLKRQKYWMDDEEVSKNQYRARN